MKSSASTRRAYSKPGIWDLLDPPLEGGKFAGEFLAVLKAWMLLPWVPLDSYVAQVMTACGQSMYLEDRN